MTSHNPGQAQCGITHYTPTSTFEYDYNNTRNVTSSCGDWLNYPNRTGATTTINCSAWGCDERLLPHLAGATPAARRGRRRRRQLEQLVDVHPVPVALGWSRARPMRAHDQLKSDWEPPAPGKSTMAVMARLALNPSHRWRKTTRPT